MDASVLARCDEPEVTARLLPLLVLDRVATCAAVEHELATLPNAADDPVKPLRCISRRWLVTDDADLKRAAEIQAQLTERGERSLPWSRPVVAAVAARHSATVLHYWSDFDLIAKVTGQPAELLAVLGR